LRQDRHGTNNIIPLRSPAKQPYTLSILRLIAQRPERLAKDQIAHDIEDKPVEIARHRPRTAPTALLGIGGLDHPINLVDEILHKTNDIHLHPTHRLRRESLTHHPPFPRMLSLVRREQRTDSLGSSAKALVERRFLHVRSVGVDSFQGRWVINGDCVRRESHDGTVLLVQPVEEDVLVAFVGVVDVVALG